MPRRLNLPDSASVAVPDAEGRLFAPSAARNLEAICDLVARHAPAQGGALELASGTGQHVVALAQRLPGLRWQPSDIDPARRASVDAYAATAGLDNLHPALTLDATAPGWGAQVAGQDLVVLVNLLHLVSTPEAQVLISETASALAPGGGLCFMARSCAMVKPHLTAMPRFTPACRPKTRKLGIKTTGMLSIGCMAHGWNW